MALFQKTPNPKVRANDRLQSIQAIIIMLCGLYKLIMQKYDIMGIIGEGAYGVVLKCRSNESN